MCIMGRDDGNTVKTPARSEEGVQVDPINPNPGQSGSSGRYGGQRKGSTKQAGGVKGPRGRKSSSSKGRTGTPSSSRGGGRSRS